MCGIVGIVSLDPRENVEVLDPRHDHVSRMNIRVLERKSGLRTVAQKPQDLPRPKYLDPADVPETQKIPVARQKALHAGNLGGPGERGVRRVP